MSRPRIDFCEQCTACQIFMCIQINEIAVNAEGGSGLILVDIRYLEPFDVTISIDQLDHHPRHQLEEVLTTQEVMRQKTDTPKLGCHSKLGRGVVRRRHKAGIVARLLHNGEGKEAVHINAAQHIGISILN